MLLCDTQALSHCRVPQAASQWSTNTRAPLQCLYPSYTQKTDVPSSSSPSSSQPAAVWMQHTPIQSWLVHSAGAAWISLDSCGFSWDLYLSGWLRTVPTLLVYDALHLESMISCHRDLFRWTIEFLEFYTNTLISNCLPIRILQLALRLGSESVYWRLCRDISSLVSPLTLKIYRTAKM